jgi:DNA topoisomerase-3
MLQLSPDCRYLQTTITFEVAGESFTCSGKTVIDPGFTSVMSWQAIPAEESLPACEIGQVWNFKEASSVNFATGIS